MKIFIDFDNTIVNTTHAFVCWYNIVYRDSVESDDIIDYSFNPQIKLLQKEITNAFTTELLYKYMYPYPGMYEALSRLKSIGCELYLITNCSDKSVVRKIEWLENNEYIKDLFSGKIFLSVGKAFDKSCIDMSDAVLIDDHRENHLKSNAKYKYAFKDHPNRTWYPTEEDGVKVFDSWKAIADDIVKIVCQNKE